jgi:hypothetical protein
MGQLNEIAAKACISSENIIHKNIQVVKIDNSILEYFKMVMDFDNESKEYRDITINEFKYELEKSLNCGAATKKIEWVTK